MNAFFLNLCQLNSSFNVQLSRLNTSSSEKVNFKTGYWGVWPQAVELDDLSPVDDLVKHSSSAVDIRTVLMQIKTFWAQLSWPDVESSYAYISKILDVRI